MPYNHYKFTDNVIIHSQSHLQSVHHSRLAQSETNLLAEQQVHPFVVDVVVSQDVVVVTV